MSVALRDGFEFEKYAVEMAADGEEGLRLATRGDHDLIILDVMLPKMSGLDVCKELRAQRQQHADHHAHRARPGDRQGRRPQARRGRLRDQAVQLHGAAGARRGRAAAHVAHGRRRRVRVRRRDARLPHLPGDEGRRAARALAARVPHPPLLHRARRRGGDAARRCSITSGATTAPRSRARSTRTSPSCGRRSRTCPASRGT